MLASIAILPALVVASYWLVCWLAFVCLLFVYSPQVWRQRNPSAYSLEVKQGQWLLNGEPAELAGSVVFWSWVMVLPLRNLQTGALQRLVICTDSTTNDDWRRLRVWLNMTLQSES